MVSITSQGEEGSLESKQDEVYNPGHPPSSIYTAVPLKKQDTTPRTLQERAEQQRLKSFPKSSTKPRSSRGFMKEEDLDDVSIDELATRMSKVETS